ncbi:SCP-2 sterol transfer family protein [Micromonospora rhizosphaerae]|uniref:SCP-2 sterol transfer family protein n=1 Tax=Micromonospora rhizosphaerae TaxID=568872 RepID=A0A1C6SH98_9ACTN|nr:SCP2 sterol-binding domain-containing protein [Micromonospora rhizosphaerae]SCL28866.1 SCP-2 sterol transfer family protein [Micromonospora rhizosphaerae]
MSETTREFFDALERHGHERVLKKTSGTIRFDLERDHEVDHWFVEIRAGVARVSRQNSDADTVIRADNVFFDRMVRGEAKPLPAWLRNEITTEGKFRFIVLLERLFAPPPGARHPRALAGDREGPR